MVNDEKSKDEFFGGGKPQNRANDLIGIKDRKFTYFINFFLKKFSKRKINSKTIIL